MLYRLARPKWNQRWSVCNLFEMGDAVVANLFDLLLPPALPVVTLAMLLPCELISQTLVLWGVGLIVMDWFERETFTLTDTNRGFRFFFCRYPKERI